MYLTANRRIARALGAVILAVLPLAAACGKDEPTTPAPPRAPVAGTVTIALADRPFQLHVPRSYAADHPVPLVVLLHGYSSNSREQDTYFGLSAQADQRGFLLALPDGMTDTNGNEFWNATDACCDIFGSGVDDSAYLSQLIDTVKASYAVQAVFVMGHSNGGFMAHRMACDHADQLTAIVALAGVVWADPARCTPSRAVTVLQIHGTADQTIAYAGGTLVAGAAYPGAEATIARWRSLDGCPATATAKPALDLERALPGAETTVTAYNGCRDGTSVVLWSVQGGAHVPALSTSFTPDVLDFLYSTLPS
jgi:polyhydroxybutyrate depolymerase